MQAGWLKLFTRELSDKWQVPTFVLSIALAGLGVYVLFANQKQSSTAECVQLCETLMAKKDYAQAGKLGVKLLEELELTPEQQNQINGMLAKLIYETELPLEKHDPKRLGAFQKYFNQTIADRPLTNEEHLMLADIRRWEGHYQKAVDHIQAVLDGDGPNRTAMLKQKLELLPRTSGDIQEEYAQTLDELLGRDDLSDAYLVWALDAKTELLFKAGQFQKAVDLIGRVLPRITDRHNQLQLQYSLSLGEYFQDKFDIAEPTLRSILDGLDARDELEAKVTLLLGKICARDDRPEEAIAFFNDLITYHTYTDYHLAAVLGKARACAVLHRYTDAMKGFEESRKLLETIGPNKLVDIEDITSAIETTADFLYKNNQLPEAIEFAHLQYDYLDPDDERNRQVLLARLGTWHRQLAEKLSERRERVGDPKLLESLTAQITENYHKAAEAFSTLSDSPGLLDRTAAEVLWQAATCYEKAGMQKDSRGLLERFVAHWPNSPLLPEAMFKLARVYQSENALTQAVGYYKRLIEEYRRTPVGLQSPVALAECYFAMGPDHYEEAVLILRDMVDDTSKQNLFTPESVEFRKAMFLLGKLYYYQGSYASCVARLEEALQRDSQNQAGPEARFLIAQSYRKIAEDLQGKIGQTADRVLKETLVGGWRENLDRSKNLYRQAIQFFEHVENLTPLETSYLKLSYIYYADCLYDLGRYEEAIQAYEGVIDHYEKTPIALASYVQIANAYQRMGQYGKIKAVLERMKWLMQHLPESAFSKPGEPFSRRDWEEWIDWNYRSGLLEYNPDFLARNRGQSATF
jgi:tetratricopeptide (TPR) repeat protein